MAPSSSDTHVGKYHRTLLQSLKGGSPEGSGQQHTQSQPVSGPQTWLDSTGDVVVGSHSGPEMLRHEATLSPQGWEGRGQSPGAPCTGKAHSDKATTTAWLSRLGTGRRCRVTAQWLLLEGALCPGGPYKGLWRAGRVLGAAVTPRPGHGPVPSWSLGGGCPAGKVVQ